MLRHPTGSWARALAWLREHLPYDQGTCAPTAAKAVDTEVRVCIS